MKTKKILIVLGFGVLAFAASFWVEKLFDATYLKNSLWLVVIFVPFFEESVKYLSYRGLRYQSTLCVPIVFLTLEYMTRLSEMGFGVDPVVALAVYIKSFGILKHIAFWIPQKLFNFRWWIGLPLAILSHSIWNWYAILPEGDDSLPASLLGIYILVFLALLLFKEHREG